MKDSKHFKNLIISAHPDDETIGCSSIIEDSYIICLTQGSPDHYNANVTKSLYKNLTMLDWNPLALYEYQDYQNIIRSILNITETISFDNVFTHYEFDKHQIHRIISNIVNVMFYNYSNIKGYFEFFTTTDLPETGLMVKKCDKKEKIRKLKLFDLRENEIKRIIAYNEYLGYKHNLEFCEGFRIKYLKNFKKNI